MVSFTATSWGQLVGKSTALANITNRAHPVPPGERTPTATDCYRYVLSRSEVDLCLTGPSNETQMNEALDALQRGPMTDDELAWMQRVGKAVAGR
jgi:predicted aldo/keto reductase-like oxidoreductase